jgi:hypothetical protein
VQQYFWDVRAVFFDSHIKNRPGKLMDESGAKHTHIPARNECVARPSLDRVARLVQRAARGGVIMGTMPRIITQAMVAMKYMAGAGMVLGVANMAVSGVSTPMVAGLVLCAVALASSLWYAREVSRHA